MKIRIITIVVTCILLVLIVKIEDPGCVDFSKDVLIDTHRPSVDQGVRDKLKRKAPDYQQHWTI